MKIIVYYSSEILFTYFENKFIREFEIHFGSKYQAYNNIVHLLTNVMCKFF